MAQPERVSMGKMAKILGISQPSLSRLVKSGMFEGTYTRDKTGYSFDVEEAQQAYSARISESKKVGGDARKASSVKADTPQAKKARKDAGDRGAAELARVKYRAGMAQLEYEEKVGNLIAKDEVDRGLAKLAVHFRDGVLNAAYRLGPVLAGKTDAQECTTILVEELTEAIRILSDADARRIIGG